MALPGGVVQLKLGFPRGLRAVGNPLAAEDDLDVGAEEPVLPGVFHGDLGQGVAGGDSQVLGNESNR